MDSPIRVGIVGSGFAAERWFWIVTVSIVTTALLYNLFRIVFKIPLPRFSLF